MPTFDCKTFVAVAVCLLGVAATVGCVDTAADKPSNSDANKANDSPKSAISKRESSDEMEMDTLVSPDRAPRNSYVRFGRTPSTSNLIEDVEDPLMSSAAKRSKNYVRFGRDGRHYVRFGRSWTVDPDQSEAEVETRDGEKTSSKRSVVDEHESLFGRGDAVPETSFARVRRSLRGYRRPDHSTILRSARNERQPAAKHYVRFGRSDGFGAARAMDELFDDNNVVDFDDGTMSAVRASLVGNNKRSGTGKTYVRFGRRSPSAPLVEVDGGYYEELGDIDGEETPYVGKRSKNYVRFGRSGGDEDGEETVDEVAKRADYIRFG